MQPTSYINLVQRNKKLSLLNEEKDRKIIELSRKLQMYYADSRPNVNLGILDISGFRQ